MLAACVALLQKQRFCALKAEPEGSCCPAPWAGAGPEFSHLREKKFSHQKKWRVIQFPSRRLRTSLRGNFCCTWNSKNCPLHYSVIQGLKCTSLMWQLLAGKSWFWSSLGRKEFGGRFVGIRSGVQGFTSAGWNLLNQLFKALMDLPLSEISKSSWAPGDALCAYDGSWWRWCSLWSCVHSPGCQDRSALCSPLAYNLSICALFLHKRYQNCW